jgi:hypothetical protein
MEQRLSWLRNYPPFMEPEGLVPCLQNPATGPYPESHEFSHHILFL